MSMRFVEKFSKTMFLFRCQARPTTFLDVENGCCSYSQNRKASLVKLLEVVAHTPPPQRVKQYQDTIALISYTILEMIGFVSQVFFHGLGHLQSFKKRSIKFHVDLWQIWTHLPWKSWGLYKQFQEINSIHLQRNAVNSSTDFFLETANPGFKKTIFFGGVLLQFCNCFFSDSLVRYLDLHKISNKMLGKK